MIETVNAHLWGWLMWKCLIYYNSHIGSDRWEWKVTLLQRMNIYKAQKSTSVELTMPVRKSDLQYHVLESITYGAVFWFLFNILLLSVYITYRWGFFFTEYNYYHKLNLIYITQSFLLGLRSISPFANGNHSEQKLKSS